MKGKYMAYVGSYSYTGKAKGITVYDIDVEKGLFVPRCEEAVNNSSYLIASSDGKTLYSIADEGVVSFRIHENGSITRLNTANIKGMRGCHLSTDAPVSYTHLDVYKRQDMDRLIDELTFYSKIDTNKIPYVYSKINVASYFKDCIEEVGLDMEARGIELGYFNYVDDDVMVIADAEQMKRVINNIISNSVKYMDKKRGIINIRIQDVGDFIQVVIEDNGKGIAAKDLPNIFDRFYRTDSSRNSSQGGSGIGLSIVRKIIEDHGGRIWATSKEGIGTEIHFVLRKYQEVIQDE